MTLSCVVSAVFKFHMFSALAKCPAGNSTYPALAWPEAAADSTMTVKCPDDTRVPAAYVRRKCLEDGVWDDYIDFSPCPSPQLLQLIRKVTESPTDQFVIWIYSLVYIHKIWAALFQVNYGSLTFVSLCSWDVLHAAALFDQLTLIVCDICISNQLSDLLHCF